MFFAMPLSLAINTSFKTSCGYLTPESKNDVFTIERRKCLAGVIILDGIISIKYYLFSTRKNRHVVLCFCVHFLCCVLSSLRASYPLFIDFTSQWICCSIWWSYGAHSFIMHLYPQWSQCYIFYFCFLSWQCSSTGGFSHVCLWGGRG